MLENSTIPAEEVFAELEQELRRLKSAVQHLHLSEQAATSAIDAAQQVVHEMAQMGQQLTAYLNRLPAPIDSGQYARQLTQLQTGLEQQQVSLQLVLEQLTESQTRVASPPVDPALPALLQSILEQQEQSASAQRSLHQLLQQGVTHYPSQQLASFLQQLVEPFALPPELVPTVTRSQQVLQELSGQVKTATSTHTQQLGSVASELKALTNTLRRSDTRQESTVGQATGQQADAIQQLLQKVHQHLIQQPTQPVSSPSEPDLVLQQQVQDLRQVIVAQQASLKRQQLLGIGTLLIVLALLALKLLGS